jgi:hypothetical protein
VWICASVYTLFAYRRAEVGYDLCQKLLDRKIMAKKPDQRVITEEETWLCSYYPETRHRQQFIYGPLL